jgi:hypothetical protein
LLVKLAIGLAVKFGVEFEVGLGWLATVPIARVTKIGCNNNKENKEVVIIGF